MYKHSKPNYFYTRKNTKKQTPRSFPRFSLPFFPNGNGKDEEGWECVRVRRVVTRRSLLRTSVARSVGSGRFGFFHVDAVPRGMNEWNRTERTNGNGASELATEGARQRERDERGRVDVVVVVVGSRRCRRSKEEEEEEIKPESSRVWN